MKNRVFLFTLLALSTSIGCATAPRRSISSSSEPREERTSAVVETVAPSGTVSTRGAGDLLQKRLEMADDEFKKKNYAAAVVDYRFVISYLPQDSTERPRVQFQIAMSCLNLNTGYDRNQKPIEDAITEFRTLFQLYPGSDYQLQGLEQLAIAYDLRARYYLFVGDFYYRQSACLFCSKREVKPLNAAVRNYKEAYDRALQSMQVNPHPNPDPSIAIDALHNLGITYEKLENYVDAAATYEKILKEYPDNNDRVEIESRLARAKEHLPPAQ